MEGLKWAGGGAVTAVWSDGLSKFLLASLGGPIQGGRGFWKVQILTSALVQTLRAKK